MNGRIREKWWPLVFSIISILILIYFRINLVDEIDFDGLVESVLIVFGVLLGFLLTVCTVIYSIDTNAMRIIKNLETFPRVMNYLLHAIKMLLFTVILTLFQPISTILLLSLFQEVGCLIIILKVLYLFLILYTTLSSVRFIDLFIYIMKPE